MSFDAAHAATLRELARVQAERDELHALCSKLWEEYIAPCLHGNGKAKCSPAECVTCQRSRVEAILAIGVAVERGGS